MKSQKNHTREITSFICKRCKVYQKESARESKNVLCLIKKILLMMLLRNSTYLTLKSTDTYNSLFTK